MNQEPARRTVRRRTAAQGAEEARRGVFAAALASSLWAQGWRASAGVTAFAVAALLAAHVARARRAGADKPVSQKLMPVAVALDAAGQPTPALLKKLARRADASVVPACAQPDGKAEALFLDSVVPGATLAEGLQKALDEALPSAADPEGDDLPAGRRLDQRELRAPGAWPGGAARRRRGAGHGAGPERGRKRTATASRPARLGWCCRRRQLRQQLRRGGRGDRRLRRAPRRDRAPAEPGPRRGAAPHRRRGAARRGDALVERPNVLTCQFEPSSSTCRRNA